MKKKSVREKHYERYLFQELNNTLLGNQITDDVEILAKHQSLSQSLSLKCVLGNEMARK